MQLCGQCSHVVSVATIATIAALVGVFFYHRKRRTDSVRNWTRVATVKKLFIYPLKSGRRKELETARCMKHGAIATENNVELRDRSFVVYGEIHHIFKTARVFPKLVLIETSVNEDGDIVFNAPGIPSINFKIPTSEGKPVSITVQNKAPVKALDCGDDIAAWLSAYLLDKLYGVRLGYHDPSFTRDIKQQFPDLFIAYDKLRIDSAGLYSDLTSYHLVNQSSVDMLNSNLTEPVTANNFRPNILIEGKDLKAYKEENWDWIKIGDVVFRNVKLCTRCIFTTVDPESAIMSEKQEPLKSLRRTNPLQHQAYVNCEGEKGVMGIHLELWREGQIRIGDEVFVA